MSLLPQSEQVALVLAVTLERLKNVVEALMIELNDLRSGKLDTHALVDELGHYKTGTEQANPTKQTENKSPPAVSNTSSATKTRRDLTKKRWIALDLILANPTLSKQEVIPLIAKAAHLPHDAARSYYNWHVKEGNVPGAL